MKVTASQLRMAAIVLLSAVLLSVLLGREQLLPLTLVASIASMALWTGRNKGYTRIAFQIFVAVLGACVLNWTPLLVQWLDRFTQKPAPEAASATEGSYWRDISPDYEAIAKERLSSHLNEYSGIVEKWRKRCLDADGYAEYERKLKEAEEKLRARR